MKNTDTSRTKGLTLSEKGAAALAVGLGLGVCAAQPARAEIIYGSEEVTISKGDYALDVDGDESPDFLFRHDNWNYDNYEYYGGFLFHHGYYAKVSSYGFGNAIAGYSKYFGGEGGPFGDRYDMAYNLGPGESIPGELYFNHGGGLFQTTEGYYYEYYSGDLSYFGPYYYGQFVDYGYGGEGGYIGFLLGGFFPESDDPGTQQNGQYGWIRVSVAEDFNSITIHDWAYQDDGSPITVGDQVPVPSTLLLLATGAAGLAGLRRKKKNA